MLQEISQFPCRSEPVGLAAEPENMGSGMEIIAQYRGLSVKCLAKSESDMWLDLSAVAFPTKE